MGARQDQPLARLDHSKLPSIPNAQLPEAYQAATTALAACVQVDECKSWSDKAAALASYARQAQDDQLERMALRIRARASNRATELIRDLPVGKGGDRRSDQSLPTVGLISDLPQKTRKEVALEAGFSRGQYEDLVDLAEVPKAEFERLVESDDPPTVTALAERGREVRRERQATERPVPGSTAHLQGRDPEDFKKATALEGAVREAAEEIAALDRSAAVRGCLDLPELTTNARRLIALCEEVISLAGGHR